MAMLMNSVFQTMWEGFPLEEFSLSWSDNGKKETALVKEKALFYQDFWCRIFTFPPHCNDVLQNTFHPSRPSLKHPGPLPSHLTPDLHR